MKITNVSINGIKNPLGYTLDGMVCSWNVCDTSSTRQVSSAIEVSETSDFAQLLYQKEGELNQNGEPLDFPLRPRTTYYYRVRVTGDAGDSAVSETQTLETGKMDEPWSAQWIAATKEDTFHPVMTKAFSAEKPVAKARLYVSGVGLFEAYLNGKKLGEEYLTPYVSDYDSCLQVITFPVEDCLQEQNELELMLGKGWYMSVFGLALQANNYGDRMAAIAELHIDYADGSEEVLVTDGSWEYYSSDVEDSGIYLGEILNRQLWAGRENPKKPVDVLADPAADPGTKNLEISHLMDRISLSVLARKQKWLI